MKRERRPLHLRRDIIRTLSAVDLYLIAGGRRGTTSENDPNGGGPCPGEYSWTCSP